MLGETLRIIRIANENIKIKNVALAVGVSPSYMSEIENCKRTPSLKLLYKLADFYTIPINQIFIIDHLAEIHYLSFQKTLKLVLDYYISKENEIKKDKVKTINK